MYSRLVIFMLTFMIVNFSIIGCSGSDGVAIVDDTLQNNKSSKPIQKSSIDKPQSDQINDIIKQKDEPVKNRVKVEESISPENNSSTLDENITYTLSFERSYKNLEEIKAVSLMDSGNIIYLGYDGGIAKLHIEKNQKPKLQKKLDGLYYIEDIQRVKDRDLLLISNGFDGLKMSDLNLTKIEDINDSLKGGWSGEIKYLKNLNFYVAYGSKGIELLHFDNFSKKVKIKNFKPANSYVQSIEISEDGMVSFVSAGYGGVKILGLLDENISTIASIKGDWVNDIEYDDKSGLLYLADGQNGIKLYDLSVANQPKKIAQYDLNSSIEQIKLIKERDLFLASDDANSLYIFALKEDKNLQLKDKISLDGIVNQIKYDTKRGKVYIATTKGLFIYDLIKESL